MKKADNFFDQKHIEKLMARMKEIQAGNKLDLSADEDLSLAIMNLVSIEEHMFFTAAKTRRLKYLEILNEAREMRKKLLKRIIKKYEGEVWCISKHLLAAAMRLYEVGTKLLGQGKKEEAWKFFEMGYQLWALFWGLNLGAVKSKELRGNLQKLGFEEDEFIDSKKIARKKVPLFARMGELVKKAIDCCIE